MKLNKKKIRYIINHKKKGESCETISKDIKLSKRRVEHIWKEYRETGEYPVVGLKVEKLSPAATFLGSALSFQL